MAYFFLIRIPNSDRYDAGGVEETTEHLLRRCPQYSPEKNVPATDLCRLDGRPVTLKTNPWTSVLTAKFAEGDKSPFLMIHDYTNVFSVKKDYEFGRSHTYLLLTPSPFFIP